MDVALYGCCTAVACFAATNMLPAKIFVLPSIETFPLDYSSIAVGFPADTVYIDFDTDRAIFGLDESGTV